MPLPSATNLFSIIASDAAGNSSTQQITLYKSAVQLTMDAVTNLTGTNATVSGTVSDTNQLVWVNGIQATVYTDGSWTATNVTVSSGGAASFDVFAGTILDDPSGAELKIQPTKPPLVRRSSYWEQMTLNGQEVTGTGYWWVDDESRHAAWNRGTGGAVSGQTYSGDRLKNGKEYGRITIEMFAPYSDEISGLVRFQYSINPSGSNILR